jgi:histidinol phosphatase-like enzyme
MVTAYDRDGVVLASPSYGDAHPKNINYKNIINRIDPVVAKRINRNGGIILSNQDGASKYKSTLEICWEFEALMESIPGLWLCLWSLPGFGDDGKYGDRCEGLLVREGDYRRIPTNISETWRRYGNFRKPSPGMFKLAKHLGFTVDRYIGDLSGVPYWADGKDSDKKAADAAGVYYIDIKQAFPNAKTRKYGIG